MKDPNSNPDLIEVKIGLSLSASGKSALPIFRSMSPEDQRKLADAMVKKGVVSQECRAFIEIRTPEVPKIMECSFCMGDSSLPTLISEDLGHFVGCPDCYSRGPYANSKWAAVRKWNSMMGLR